MAPPKIPSDILDKAKNLYARNRDKAEIVKFVRARCDVTMRAVHYRIKEFERDLGIEGDPGIPGPEDPALDGEVAFKGLYAYSSLTDDYVFLTEKLLGRPITLKGDTVKEILKRYSRFDDTESTVDEIGSSFGLSRKTVVFILKALGKTHDSLPVTDEDLMTGDPEEIVEDLLGEKNITLQREWNKRNWKQVTEDARKWRAFQLGELNPYKEFVENFTYQHKSFKLPRKTRIKTDSAFFSIMCDVHFGAYALQKDLYHGKEYSIEIAKTLYKKYVDEFYKVVESRKAAPEVLYIYSLGDITHSGNGKTDKGTPLENVLPYGEPQVDAGFYSLDYQIQYGLDLGYKKIVVIVIPGNHWYFGDWAIGRMVQIAYAKDERVSVEIATERWHALRFRSSLFIAEHGASAFFKSLVPKSGAPRESYIQRLFLGKPELLQDTKYKYFLTADRHNLEYSDAPGFEFIRFGSSVAGDKYADHLNLHSRPKQAVLEVGPKGVQSLINIYLD